MDEPRFQSQFSSSLSFTSTAHAPTSPSKPRNGLSIASFSVLSCLLQRFALQITIPLWQRILTLFQYTNDSSLQNVHWAIATGIFGKRDVGRIEREFLDVLDWELMVSEDDIADLYPSIIALYPPHIRTAAVPPLRPTRCPTFTLDYISDDSDDSTSSASSSPRTPCDSEKTTQSIKHDPLNYHDSPHMGQISQPQSQWSQNQKFIAALASEYCPLVPT